MGMVIDLGDGEQPDPALQGGEGSPVVCPDLPR